MCSGPAAMIVTAVGCVANVVTASGVVVIANPGTISKAGLRYEGSKNAVTTAL